MKKKQIKMDSIFFRKNKKSTIVLKELVILALAAIVFLAVTVFFFRIIGSSASNEDAPSQANFERLYSTIKELIESPNDADYRIINYYIGYDRMVIGFERDWDENPHNEIIAVTLKIDEDDPIYRPSKCGSSACLCLYNEDLSQKEDEIEEGVLDCKSDGLSGKKIDFVINRVVDLSTREKSIKAGLEEESKTKQIYIEKMFDGSEYSIYITADMNIANIRKERIDKGIASPCFKEGEGKNMHAFYNFKQCCEGLTFCEEGVLLVCRYTCEE